MTIPFDLETQAQIARVIFEEIAAGREVSAGQQGALRSFVTAAAKHNCKHSGYSFEKHGRCCFNCGAFVTDFGD